MVHQSVIDGWRIATPNLRSWFMIEWSWHPRWTTWRPDCWYTWCGPHKYDGTILRLSTTSISTDKTWDCISHIQGVSLSGGNGHVTPLQSTDAPLLCWTSHWQWRRLEQVGAANYAVDEVLSLCDPKRRTRFSHQHRICAILFDVEIYVLTGDGD